MEQDGNTKSFTVFTLAEFIKIFGESEYHNLSKAIRLKKIVEKFVKQCIYTGSLENYDDCVYFNSLKAYVNFEMCIRDSLSGYACSLFYFLLCFQICISNLCHSFSHVYYLQCQT